MHEHPAITRLARYRLAEDLTFDELAAQMAAAGYPIRSRALHWALTGRLKRAPIDRTLYRIEEFVAHVLDRQPVPKRRSSAAGGR